MAQRKLVMNRYRTLGKGVVVGDAAAMPKLAPLFDNRVLVCRQILRLSYRVLSEAFDGIKGRAQLEGCRAAMIEDIASWPGPVTSWRESVARLKGLSDNENLA